MLRKIIILAIAITVSGCGFRQRGAVDVPHYLRVVQITPDDPYEYLQRELRYRLAKQNIKVISHPEKNVLTLDLSKPDVNEQVLAFGDSGQAQRLKLIMQVNFRFMDQSLSITRTREMSITNSLLLSNEGQKQIIEQELLNEIVNELIRQICTRPVHKNSVLDSSSEDNSPC